jgi:acyl-CoA synthetase (AMP-forming)/AMP-acid ligase II
MLDEPRNLLISRAAFWGASPAIIDMAGTSSYADLLDASARVAAALLTGGTDLQEERVAFRMTPGFPWVATQWGIWRAGGVAVPLALDAPSSELDYCLENSRASALIYHEENEPAMAPLAATRNIHCAQYSRSRRTASTASLAEATSTSSRVAATRLPPWRLRSLEGAPRYLRVRRRGHSGSRVRRARCRGRGLANWAATRLGYSARLVQAEDIGSQSAVEIVDRRGSSPQRHGQDN